MKGGQFLLYVGHVCKEEVWSECVCVYVCVLGCLLQMSFCPVGGRHAPFRDAQPVGSVPEKAEPQPWVAGLAGRPPGIAGIAGSCWAGTGALPASPAQDNC